jgi:hypothetical protein
MWSGGKHKLDRVQQSLQADQNPEQLLSLPHVRRLLQAHSKQENYFHFLKVLNPHST